MTHAADAKGPNGAKAPAVFWREGANQFMAYIGYRLSTKGVRPGRRVRAAHYLGRDPREALLKALLLDRQWDRVVADEKARVLSLKAQTLRGDTFFFNESNLPVWPTERLRARRAMTIEDLERKGQVVVCEDDEVESRQVLPLSTLRELFLRAQKARIGLSGRRGLKEGTYRELAKALKTSLRALPADLDALTLTRENCRHLVDYWSSPERGVKERTAANYSKAFLRMITWADCEEIRGFRIPKVGGLFKFSNVRGTIQPFDVVKMTSLMRAATNRCKLYLLLGLNAGYTQIDIAHLKRSEIVEERGETFLVRAREKTSHQNDFRTKHYLWPETAALLKQQLVADNESGLALLNVNGRPLIRGKVDNVKDSIVEVRDTAGIPEFTFKQLRKFGASAIHRVTVSPDIARQYAGHRIASALSHYVRDDFFEPLTAALKKWREELKRDGVI